MSKKRNNSDSENDDEMKIFLALDHAHQRLDKSERLEDLYRTFIGQDTKRIKILVEELRAETNTKQQIVDLVISYFSEKMDKTDELLKEVNEIREATKE